MGNLFDIWATRPPCSGECVIMGGASDSWVTYGQSTARSVLVQLRAFAAFDPQALPNACGPQGIMLRFGGMTLDNGKVTCNAKGDWGQTGAQCPTQDDLGSTFHDIVTLDDDNEFFKVLPGGPGGLDHGLEITLETDQAKATVSMEDGVTIQHKSLSSSLRDSCDSIPQPTLNFDFRCKATGGVSDFNGCVKTSQSKKDVDEKVVV